MSTVDAVERRRPRGHEARLAEVGKCRASTVAACGPCSARSARSSVGSSLTDGGQSGAEIGIVDLLPRGIDDEHQRAVAGRRLQAA